MPESRSRRAFLAAVAAGAAHGTALRAQPAGRVSGFDHVALPMQNPEAMAKFYEGLGFETRSTANLMSVYVGTQMINFHRPNLWQNSTFTLRAPAAKPPCGDLCFVWEGSASALKAMLDRIGARIEVGPADRSGGRRQTGSSTYIRDPDGNLLEFIIYA